MAFQPHINRIIPLMEQSASFALSGLIRNELGPGHCMHSKIVKTKVSITVVEARRTPRC